jgi:hypothetical protein
MRVGIMKANVVGVWALLTVGLICCGRNKGLRNGTAGEAPTCLADSIGELQLVSSVPKCASDRIACDLKCRLRDAGSCLGLAYAGEGASPPEELRGLYRNACLAGAANACTNYAASLWVGQMSEEQLACVRRTFEKACAVGEQFACGMVARVALESGGEPDVGEWRRYLQGKCDQVGGFSCRVLAKHLESGTLGKFDAEAIPGLLKRACDGGDIYACGTHATAAETFN